MGESTEPRPHGAVVIHVSEEDMHLAMSELHNCGRFELVGRDGARVLLVDDSDRM